MSIKKQIQTGDIYHFWQVVGPKVVNRQIECLCLGCQSKKMVDYVALTKGSSKSCGCQKDSLRQNTNIDKYGSPNFAETSVWKEKYKDTVQAKYGVEHYSQTSKFREKFTSTMNELYGVSHALQSPEIKNKVKQTFIDRYGKNNYSQTLEWRERVIKTNQIAYRSDWGLQNKEVREKIKATTLERYNVTSYIESQDFNSKKLETCQKKYGLTYVPYTKETLLKRQQSNIKKYGEKHHMRIGAQKIDGKYIADFCTEYKISPSFIYYLMNNFGETEVFSYINGEKGTCLERQFVSLVNSAELQCALHNKLPLEFKTNYRPDFRLTLGNRILYINIDGLYYHTNTERREVEPNYHKEIREAFSTNGHTIFQFREDELRNSPEVVRSIVLNYFNLHEKKYHARNLEVRKVPISAAIAFFEQNHLMKSYKLARAYGLYDRSNNELLACMSVKLDKDKALEISRFCNKKYISVRGGFSKLLNHIQKSLEPIKIISFCDLRYSTGKSYELLGFKLQKISLGWQWTDFKNTYNRLKCRANMDDRKLTQAEHAKELKWYKIYDAGQAKYAKELT